MLSFGMLDSTILNHAARVLASIDGDVPADAALRRYLVDAPRLGTREKRGVSRAVFAYFRWLQWLEPKESWQKQLDHAWTLQERFTADEKSIKAEALAARAVPAWLRDEMELPAGYLRQLQREPVLWLRARPGTTHAVARELSAVEPAPALSLALEVSGSTGSIVSDNASAPASAEPPGGSPPTEHSSPARVPTRKPEPQTPNPPGQTSFAAPAALRYTGYEDLFLTSAFHRGAFEIQDLASQLVGHACAPQEGETWWDACAGEGGKLLHLADLMANRGVIWATDRNERRLRVLKRRAARAQVFNYRATTWDGSAKLPTRTKFDGILVDAPCSGVGTWQRNPHARWTVSPRDVQELAATQLALLNHVAEALRPNGRLVYSACTLTRSETVRVAETFSAAHPDLEPAPILGAATQLTLWPHRLNANGMFIAAWRRK